MADMRPVQVDDAGTSNDAKAEHSQFGAGETGGGKPADGIDGSSAVKRKDSENADATDLGVPPEEDPKMGV